MSDDIVSEEDIVKYYAPEEIKRYRAFQKLESMHPGMSGDEIQGILTDIKTVVTSDTLTNWQDEITRPKVAECIQFLKERNLLPLTTESPTLGLMTYLTGLNWHAGNTHVQQGQPASCPQFYLANPLHLDEIARALDLPLQHPEKCERYALPARVALLFSEMGLPTNGRKASFQDAYPAFLEALLLNQDRDRVALFLGTQALTRAGKHADGVLLKTIEKETEELAQRTGNELHELYREVFPDVYLGKPKLVKKRVRKKKDQDDVRYRYYATFRVSRKNYYQLTELTHAGIERELRTYTGR